MAKKSFVLSNGDGRVIFSNTGSNGVYLDDAINGHISASNLYIANNYTIRSITASPTTYRMLSASAGQFLTSSVSGGGTVTGALGYNGTSSVVTRIMNPSDYDGIPLDQTYLSGSYRSGIKVININTVSSGALKPAYGGTGLSGSQYASSKNLILEGSGSSPTAFSVLSASASGTLIVSGEGRFHVQYPSYKPDVRFYAAPGTYTWTRPIGARFARVILQGAGGGGGGGGQGGTAHGGGGGASGGYTDIIIDVSSITASTINVGTGGTGGAGGTSAATSMNGVAGGNTLWNDLFRSYTAGGGGGGTRGSNSGNMSTAGVGLTKNGGRGAAPITSTTADLVYGMPSGGGKGGGTLPLTNGGTITPVLSPANKNFGYTFDTTGLSINTALSSGSSGAAYPSTPLDAVSGAGGGGGGATTTAGQFSSGSRGGDGYALIISW